MSGSAIAYTLRAPAGVARAAGGGTGAACGPGQGDAPAPVPPSWLQGESMAGEWLLQDFIELGALPGAVPCARLHVRQVLWEY